MHPHVKFQDRGVARRRPLSGRSLPEGRTAAATRWTLTVAGLTFVAAYLVGSFRPTNLTATAMLVSLAPLVAFAVRRVTGFVRWYGVATLAFGIAVTWWRPIEPGLASASMVSMANVIGLLVVLRVIDFPLREREYRETFERLSTWLRHRRVTDGASSVALGFLLGQLLAFTVVGVTDAILNREGSEQTRYVTRWAARGLTATLICALAFPTVSIAIDVLGVSPHSYLVLALPLGLLLAAILMMFARHRSTPLHKESAAAPGRRPMLELATYLIVIVGGILILATSFPGASYLAVVAITTLGAAGGLSLLQSWRQRRVATSLHQFGSHAFGWWRYSSSEIVIFSGGGVLLYSIQRLGAVEPVAKHILGLGGQPPGTQLVYFIFSSMVFVLFMVGVHPIVSVHVIAVAITTLPTDWLSVPMLTLALMIGTVSALTPSPFSALSNLRASLIGTEVIDSVSENLLYGVTLLFAGNGYLLILSVLGF